MLVLVNCEAANNEQVESALNTKGHITIFYSDKINRSLLAIDEVAAMLSSACDILLDLGSK